MPTAAGIYYFLSGDPSVAANSLILLHGAGGLYQHWPYQLRRVPGWRVLAPDLPGHGHSEGQVKESVEEYASWLDEWLELVGVKQSVLVGHSMAAAICLALARAHPERVEALVLIGGGPRYAVNPKLLEDLLIPTRMQSAIDLMAKWSFAQGSDANLQEAYTRQLMGNPLGVLYADLTACSRVDLTSVLNEVKQPALILCGSEDRMMPPENSIRLKNGLRRSQFQVIDGGGHMVMLEKSREVAHAVEKFLGSL
jgi:pimeloyl-ACP methyl ester carboxylesterase